MIYRSTILFIIYKTFFVSKKCLRKNLRCIAKFVITLALRFKFAFLILLICKVKFVLLIFVKIALLHKLIYRFIIDNKSVQIIDKVGNVKWKIGEVGGKYKVIFISSDYIFAKVYITMISKIYVLLYGIKLNIKFTDVFGC